MKIILFDFDGVLVDTLLLLYDINKEVNEDLSLEEYKSLFKGNIYKAVRDNGEVKKRHPNFNSLYQTKTRELKIPQSLKDVLDKLSKKYSMAIISSTPTSLIEDILKREEVLYYFKDILGADVHRSKVVKIKSILEKYNIDPSDAVFITDTAGDIKEGAECGVKSIAVTWGFHDRETLEKAKPAKIIDDPEDLINAIEEI